MRFGLKQNRTKKTHRKIKFVNRFSQWFQEPEKAALAAPQRSRADSLQSNSLFLSSSDEDSSHPSPEPYSFSYGFSDEENGSEVSREESQDASGNIIG